MISEISYISKDAERVAAWTQDTIAIGSSLDSSTNIISLLRDGKMSSLDSEATGSRLQSMRSQFEIGKEYVIEWEQNRKGRVEQAMDDLGSYLSDFDPALSYEGTDKKVVWRKSCWFASDGVALPFLDTEEAISKFDGDLKDGLTGLKALHDAKVRSSMEYLKYVLDGALVTTSKAVGIDMDLIRRCTVRYRAIKYTPHGNNPGGIGLHPDGNLLSALITNGSGLRVYDLDGTVRFPGHSGTIMMGGSTLYRWSQGKYPPTFHDVDVTGDQVKVSLVAFFNFPDMQTIPRSVLSVVDEREGFFHDIRRIKEDDKLPSGELSTLWDVIIKEHKLVLPPAVAVS